MKLIFLTISTIIQSRNLFKTVNIDSGSYLIECVVIKLILIMKNSFLREKKNLNEKNQLLNVNQSFIRAAKKKKLRN